MSIVIKPTNDSSITYTAYRKIQIENVHDYKKTKEKWQT